MSWTTTSIAELGCKTLTAVGSIAAGTAILELDSNPGFEVGDAIIIATGGEAGGGLRGTVGVGGVQWPTTTFADLTALEAGFAGTAEGTRAWVASNGKVYYRGADGTQWNDLTLELGLYYYSKIAPKALFAEILDVDGTTLTLDAEAVVTSTDADIYFDNFQLLDDAWHATGIGLGTPNQKWTVPAGTYALSREPIVAFQVDWVVAGAGKTVSKFVSPRGAVGQFRILQSERVIIRDLGFVSNARNAGGFGLLDFGDTSFPGPPYGFLFESSFSCIVQRCRGDNIFNYFVGTRFGADIWAYDCEYFDADGQESYTQWKYNWANHSGGGFWRCSAECDKLIKAFEMFQCTGSMMLDIVGRNTIVSSNSSSGWVIRATVTVEALSQISDTSISPIEPIMNINSNIDNSQGNSGLLGSGGIIDNPRIVQEGAINEAGVVLTAITIGEFCPNVLVRGPYPTAPDDPNGGGYISYPDYDFNKAQINSTGANTVIDGIRFDGHNADPFWGDIRMSPGPGIVRNCVADTITDFAAPEGAVTLTDNQTNAEFEV